jgi:hypothetical protein
MKIEVSYYTSPNGTTWTSGTFVTSNDLKGIISGNNQFVAVDTDGIILPSTGRITWTPYTNSYVLCGVTYKEKT